MPEAKSVGVIQAGTASASTFEQAGLKVHLGVVIYDHIDFEAPVHLNKAVCKGSKLGAFSYCGFGTNISDANIGRYCSIGENVYIGLGIHRTEAITTSPAMGSTWFDWHNKLDAPMETSVFRPVEIGHDVWIGTGATIVGGVTIGHGAVIGTGAVVTKDVEPYTIVAGVAAQPIRKRFSDDLIERLLRLQPWNYDLRAAYAADVTFAEGVTAASLARFETAIETKVIVDMPRRFIRLEPLSNDRWRMFPLPH